jgi:xylulokinase
MKDSYLLGIDLGTTATKAALYTSDGQFVSEGRAEVPLRSPAPGVVEQRLEEIHESAARAVRDCVGSCRADRSAIAAMAFDSQMAGVGFIDEDFRPAAHFDSWLDMRCRPYIEQMDREYGDEIAALTGCPPTCDHGPKILWWMHERPGEYHRIAKFLMPSAYVAGRCAGLSAGQAYIDHTFLHFTSLSDAVGGTWSGRLCEAFGVDRRRLPRIVAPWDVVGELREEGAREFDLPVGIPIAAGCGDTAAGVLGAGLVRRGMLLDTAGTASVLACSTDRFVADRTHRALLTMRSAVPGLWHPLAYIGGGGLALRWLRDHFGDGEGTYEALFMAAASVPAACDGLLFSPHLGGRICPAAPEMRGAWIGFSWSHTKAHFIRSALESIAYEYAYYLDILRELVPELELIEARVIGGGSQGRGWNQMKADVLGVPYRRVTRPESATWGVAMIAGKAAGLITDLASHAADSAAAEEERAMPDASLRERYAQAYSRYRRWQETLQNGFYRDA